MKGYASHNSPFARKVRVAAIETGQGEAIDWTMVDLVDRPAVLGQANPLDQVPVVIQDDGTALYDSPVICQYLDSLHDGPKLYPEAGAARWTALRLEALGDGLGAASAALAGERRRPRTAVTIPSSLPRRARSARRWPRSKTRSIGSTARPALPRSQWPVRSATWSCARARPDGAIPPTPCRLERCVPRPPSMRRTAPPDQ